MALRECRSGLRARAKARAAPQRGNHSQPDWERHCHAGQESFLPAARTASSAPEDRFAEPAPFGVPALGLPDGLAGRSEEHTSELQSLMRISYAVFCLKKKNN